jgi:hypothetical protein
MSRIVIVIQKYYIRYLENMTVSVVRWSEFRATDPEARVRFPELHFLRSSGSVTGSTQPREYN